MLKTAAVELPDVAWDCTSADAGTVPRAPGMLQGGQPAPDVMGRHAEGGAWLSPVLCEEVTGAQQGDGANVGAQHLAIVRLTQPDSNRALSSLASVECRLP